MNWTELQNAIGQRYCGTVLVLDDEILRTVNEQRQLDPLFLNAKSAFEKAGMLCDLRHIEDEFEDEVKVSELCCQLRRSDTVVLDWYLGAGKDAQKDPSNALRILKELSNMGGFRFVVIQSKEGSETILESLKATYEDAFSTLSAHQSANTSDDANVSVIVEDAVASPTTTPMTDAERPSTYRLSTSLYVSVVAKDRNPASVVDIPHFFVSGLKAAYPDHLHWVGFDFAARVRELLPRILDVLPRNSDLAIVFQALLQGENELGDNLVECLAEEIRELLRAKPLQSATDSAIIDRLVEKLARPEIGTKTAAEIKAACSFVHTLRSEEKDAFADIFGNPGGSKQKTVQQHLSKFIANTLEIADGAIESSHHGYGSLREHFQSVVSNRLYPGVILNRPAQANQEREWLLCLSPACDCARGDGNREYLFVEGKSLEAPEPEEASVVQTCIAVGGGYVHVKWSSKWFQTRNCSPLSVDGYTFHSRLRDDFVQLLIQRVFGWQSRVGVNTSERLRVLRERK